MLRMLGRQSDRLVQIGLSILFLSGAVLVWRRGPIMGGDSHMYLDGAQRLLGGDPLEPVQQAYSGYVVLLALVDGAGLGLRGLLLLQLTVAGLAAAALFWLGRDLGGLVMGAIAAFLFVANPDIARWHGYVLTESVYISMVVLTTWAAYRAWTRRGIWYAAAVAVAVLAAAVRPTGWLLLPIVAAFLVMRGLGQSKKAFVASLVAALLIAVVIVLSPIARQRIGIGNPAGKIVDGVVIPGYEAGWIDMPADHDVEEAQRPVAYALEHPFAVARLGILRIGTEFAGVRPYYSKPHNLFLVVLLSFVYLTAAVGWYVMRWHPMSLFILAILVAHVGFVAVAFASYDGRFLLYTFPLLGLFSGRAVAELGQKMLPPVVSSSER